MKPKVAVVVALIALVAIIAVFLALPQAIPQDPCYHRFVDKRPFCEIPNGWNVISNIPFLIVGIVTLMSLKRIRMTGNAITTFAFAAGLIFTTFGSGAYHWHPADATLFWDRIGIVISVMALVALLVEEYAGGYAIVTLITAEIIGIGSLLWWYAGNDLRLYGVVQFFPALLIVVLPMFFRPRHSAHGLLTLVIAFYAIAKLFETYDGEIYRQLYFVSGHALKHFAAALSTAAVWLWMMRRQLIAVESSPPGSGVRSSPTREITT